MQITYCDKCKKKIKDKDRGLYLPFFGTLGTGIKSFHLCKGCGDKFKKIVEKFLAK